MPLLKGHFKGNRFNPMIYRGPVAGGTPPAFDPRKLIRKAKSRDARRYIKRTRFPDSAEGEPEEVDKDEMEVDSDTAEDEKADEDMAATEADTNTGAAQRAEEDVVDTGMDTHTEPQAGDENAEDMDSDATLTDDTNDPVVEIPRLVVTMHFPANPPPTAAPATQAPATAAPAAPAPAITVPAFTTSRQWSRRFRDPNYQFACHRE